MKLPSIEIPEIAEIASLNQWLVAGLNKAPIGRSGNPCSPSNEGEFMSFDDACKLATSLGENSLGVGLALTEKDPYIIINIDNVNYYSSRFPEALLMIGSYCEYSLSGNGLTAILKSSSIPPESGLLDVISAAISGTQQRHTNVYSKERYVIVTGDKIHGNKDKKIRDVTSWREYLKDCDEAIKTHKARMLGADLA